MLDGFGYFCKGLVTEWVFLTHSEGWQRGRWAGSQETSSWRRHDILFYGDPRLPG